MSEEVKYTEQDLARARAWKKGGMCSCEECTAVLIASVRAEAQQARVVVAVCSTLDNTAARLDAAEKLARAAQETIDWEDEYRGPNHLSNNPPHHFAQLAVALAKWKEAAGK